MKIILSMVLAALFLFMTPLIVLGLSSKLEIEDEDTITYYSAFRTLEAAASTVVDFARLVSDTSGFFLSIFYDIHMLARDTDSLTGEYYLDIEATILMDWHEAMEQAALDMGVDISGLGITGSGDAYGWINNESKAITTDEGFQTYDFAEIQKLDPKWKSVIKDDQGRIVTPKKGSYLMFKEVKFDYSVELHDSLFGDISAITESDVWLFLLIEPPAKGMHVSDSLPVKVYLTYPDLALKGIDLWIEGEGKAYIDTRIEEIDIKD